MFNEFFSSQFWSNNTWYYLFAAIATIITFIYTFKHNKKKTEENRPGAQPIKNALTNNSNISNTTNVPIHIINEVNSFKKVETLTTLNEQHLKDTTKILFIDDNHKEYKIVSILKKAGWTKTSSTKDINDLDCPLIKESDIIFVDINGVGLQLFQDQGLGLAAALKKKYSNKKIVIYSAETTGDRFHEALRMVDHCLPKNADAIQFINLIENLLKPNA